MTKGLLVTPSRAGKRELVVLLSLSSWCLVMVLWLFLAVPWVCLRFVIVVFPDHTRYFCPRKSHYGCNRCGSATAGECLAVNKHIYMAFLAFLALEKAFNCVRRIFIWWALRKLCYPGSEHQWAKPCLCCLWLQSRVYVECWGPTWLCA